MHSLATRALRTVMERGEETFPAVKERVVCVLWLCVQTRIYCHVSVLLAKETKYVVTSLWLFFLHRSVDVGESSIQGE
jgi:hypothetical protein